eukprot:1128927-Rhodomonas_salina.1
MGKGQVYPAPQNSQRKRGSSRRIHVGGRRQRNGTGKNFNILGTPCARTASLLTLALGRTLISFALRLSTSSIAFNVCVTAPSPCQNA